MSWFLWALLNPFFYNASNYFEKFLIDKKVKNPVTLLILSGVLYLIIGLVILLAQRIFLIPLIELLSLLGAGILLQLYLIPFYKALAIDEASRVTPLFQFVPVFSFILGFFFLGQKLTTPEIIGFAIILLGGFLISIENTKKGIFTIRKSLWYMIFTCLAYAFSVILFQFVIIHQDFWVSFAYKALGSAIGSVLLFLIPTYRRDFLAEYKSLVKNTAGILLLNQFCIVFGQFAESMALTMASAALVTIVESIQSVFALLVGIGFSLWFPHIIKEDMSKKNITVKIIAIVLITGGLIFIYH